MKSRVHFWSLGPLLWVPAGAVAQPQPDAVLAPAVRVEGDADDAAPVARDATPFSTVIRLHSDEAVTGTLASALVEAPGTDVRRTGGHRQELQLRGASAGQVSVYLDDVPLTGARGGAFDLSLMPAEVLERVEVLRGPNAATYGGGALGGVLHLHTRDTGASAGPGRPPGRGARRAAMRLGSFGERGLDFGQSVSGERYDVLAVGGATRSEGDFPFEDVQGHDRVRKNNAQEALHGLARARARLGSDTRLTALAVGVRDTRGEPGVEQFENTEAHATRERWVLALAADDPSVLEGRLSTGASLHGSGQADAWRDPSPELWGAPKAADLDDLAVGGRAFATTTMLPDHLPRLAVEGRHERAESRIDGAYDNDRRDQRTSGAIVLSDEYTILDGRLTLGAALRVDDHDGRSSILVPQGGAVLEPVPGLTLRGNVGRVFRDPSFDELYYRGPGIRGNPELRPEDGLAWDAGAAFLLMKGESPGVASLSVEAAVFGQRYERIILFLPVQAQLIEAVDDHGARILGQEAALDARLGPGRLTVAYTHLDARFDVAPTTNLPHRPAHRLFARLQGRVQRAVASVSCEARSEVRADRFGYRRVAGHRLWNLGLEGPLGADFRAGLSFRNLLDVRDAQDAVQQPLPGRSLLFSLEFSPLERRTEEEVPDGDEV